MADNVNVRDAESAEKTIATDEVDSRHYQIVKLAVGADGVATAVTDLASAAHQVTQNAALTAIAASVDGLEGYTDGLEAAFTTLSGHVDGLEALATALNGYVDGLEGKDFATQTTLAALLAKVIAAPSTEAKQDAANTLLTAIAASVDGLEGFTDGLEGLATSLNGYTDGLEAAHGSDLAKLEAIRALLAGTLLVDSASGSGQITGQGRKVSTTVGTAVALAASTTIKWVLVTALATNTDRVAVGAAGVLATVGSQTGIGLAPGQAVLVPATNLANVYVDVRVSGEGVTYAYGV